MLIGEGEMVEHDRGVREAGEGLGRADAEERRRAVNDAKRAVKSILLVLVGSRLEAMVK